MTFEEYLSSLKGKTVGVIGVGVSNRPLIEKLLEWHRGTLALAALLLAAAVAGGSVITSEMEAFFAVCPCPILAVTGSDGKTTTTTIISKLLAAEGKIVHVGGNIGHPLLCDTPEIAPEDMAVLELSSFQLMTMQPIWRLTIWMSTRTIRSMWMQRQTSLHTRMPAILLCSTPTTMTRCVRPRKRWARSVGSPGSSGWKTACSARTA